jgi:hypothetical protein
VGGSDDGRCGERGVGIAQADDYPDQHVKLSLELEIASRTGAKDSSAQLKGLGAVASRRPQ